MDKQDAAMGWLCIFDRDPKKSWEEKISMRRELVEGKSITIVGL